MDFMDLRNNIEPRLEQRKQYERLTALKSVIKEITNGTYHKQEGWEPNYIISPLGKNISRVNIIATIIQKFQTEDGRTVSLKIDDGSDQIDLRVFDEISIFQNINIGDIVQVIGKPREFNNSQYIVPEIIKKIDRRWLFVRKLEFEKKYGNDFNALLREKTQPQTKPITKDQKPAEESVVGKTNKPVESILDYIKQNDKDNGIEIEQIIKNSDVANCEKIINDLLKLGEIFEVRPGRVKVL